MAITAAQLQTALGTNPRHPLVVRAYGTYGTTQQWYITGGNVYPGRHRFVSTTAANNATNQAVEVVAALKA